MIYFVTTASHRYTHACVERDLPGFTRIAYPMLFARRRLPRGTYIFSDFDRLSPWQLEVAAGVYRQLGAEGCRVINDPAKVLQRLPLLKRLNRDGVNSFSAWAADEAHEVDRFPVFIRTQAAHRGVLSDVLQDHNAVSKALDEAVRRGHPLKDLMIVEYRAEPIAPGLFRKLSVYKVGATMVAALNVHERSWTAKYGELGVASQALYDEEHRIVRDNPFGQAIASAFSAAAIEYGRADFGLVENRPEIYEINTNPSISNRFDHPFAIRVESGSLAYTNLTGALEVLNQSGQGHVRMARPELLNGLPRWKRLAPGFQWVP